MCRTTLLDGRLVRLYIGGSLDDDMYILSTYQSTLLFLLPCLLGLAVAGGYFLSRRAMRPVDRLTKAALNIGIGNLSTRLPFLRRGRAMVVGNSVELTTGSSGGSSLALSKFSADASHDLRTSITVILATAQLSLDRRRKEDEYRSDLERIVSDCRIAPTMLDALLSLARSGNFVHEVAFQRINVTELVVAGCRRVEDLAESSHVTDPTSITFSITARRF